MANIDTILESFNLDPISNFQNEDPYKVFQEDGNIFLESVLTEASNGTTKKNIIQKLWAFIKKVIRWIANAFSKFMVWVKGLFKRKGKPVDQILSTIKTDVPPKRTAKDKKITVSIPSDPASELKLEPSVDMIFKDIMMQFDVNRGSIKFKESQIQQGIYYDDDDAPAPGGKQGNVIGQPAVQRGFFDDFKRVLLNMGEPSLMRALCELVRMIEKNDVESLAIVNKYEDYVRNCDKAYHSYGVGWVEITLHDLMEFQKEVNELNRSIESVDIPERGAVEEANNVKITETVNKIASTIASIQMGINTITSTIRSCYMADASYFETIDTTETLSEFVGKCIEGAVPPKYISYNSYLLSTKKLKGDGDRYKPCWGQSRVVFFPEDKNVVHKIALSGWGIRANKSEMLISDKFKGETSSLLALVLKSTKNNVIIDMERVDTKRKKPEKKIEDLIENIQSFAKKSGIPLDIGMDIHAGNVGFKGNNIVAVDYGNIIRSSTE